MLNRLLGHTPILFTVFNEAIRLSRSTRMMSHTARDPRRKASSSSSSYPLLVGDCGLRVGRTSLGGGVGFFVGRAGFSTGFLRGGGGKEGDDDGDAFGFGALVLWVAGVGGVAS